MFHVAGLSNVECAHRMLRADLAFLRRLVGGHLAEPSVAARFTDGDLDTWWQDLAAAEEADHFHFGFGVFSTVGLRP